MNILDIFYNHIVKEAATGRINNGFFHNILFETYIEETNEKVCCSRVYEGVLVPTLTIKDKEQFDKLLLRYVELCLDFYDDSYYHLEVIDDESEFEKYGICKEKVIMSLLWSNATYEDFNDPISFLKKRIAFLESNIGETSHKFDFSPTLNGNINLSIKKDILTNETPYKIVESITNEDGMTFVFPEIKFGLDEDTIYIYAIQNKPQENNSYSKKLNRILYKIGEGFDAAVDNYDMYEEGNLKDVTPSFLVSLNMAISHLNSLGFDKICVPSILVTRWNAKKIGLQYFVEKGKYSEEKIEQLLTEQQRIQENLTEKHLRTFLRLAHHYEGISIESYPFDNDSQLHLQIDGPLISDNSLLSETAKLVRINNEKNYNNL